MSTLLTAQSLHVDTAFGPLFTNLSFTLKKGDRIGLIGYNGCGKSTLLQVLDGTIVVDDPDDVRTHPAHEQGRRPVAFPPSAGEPSAVGTAADRATTGQAVITDPDAPGSDHTASEGATKNV